MMKFVSEYKWLLLILFSALVIRVGYFTSVKAWEESFMKEKIGYADAGEYQTLAVTIIEKGSYPEHMFLDTYRTPVFPVYVAFLYLIFGIKPYIVLLSNILLNLVSIVFLYSMCRKLFGNNIIALIASALYALEPNIIKLVTEFGTETLHSTLMIISVYYFITGVKEKKNIYLIISPVLFGIAALTRPINLYFYVLCLLFIAFYPGELLKNKIKYAAIFILFYFISITPWMLRNYMIYDHFSTNAFRGTAFIFNAGITKAKVTGENMDTALVNFVNSIKKTCEENNIKNPFEVDKQTEIVGLDYINQHLDVYINLQIKGMLNFFISPLNNSKYSIKSKIPIGIYFVFIYLLVLYGAYKMVKNKLTFYMLSFLALVIYFCFLTGIIGLSRYRMPTTPFYLIIASYGIFCLINLYKEKVNLKQK